MYKVPSVGEYSNFPVDKIKSVPKSTSEQRTLVNDSKYKAMQVPGFKYDTDCYIKTKPRILETKLFPARDKDK